MFSRISWKTESVAFGRPDSFVRPSSLIDWHIRLQIKQLSLLRLAKPDQFKNEDVSVSQSVHVDVGRAINPGVSKMLATVFSAVLFAVSLVPAGDVGTAASGIGTGG